VGVIIKIGTDISETSFIIFSALLQLPLLSLKKKTSSIKVETRETPQNSQGRKKRKDNLRKAPTAHPSTSDTDPDQCGLDVLTPFLEPEGWLWLCLCPFIPVVSVVVGKLEPSSSAGKGDRR